MTETAETTGQVEPKQGIEPLKGWLVERGDAIGAKAGAIRNWKSQFRILLESARHESEPAVILNLLRYQAARNKDWFKDGLLQVVEADLEACRAKAQKDAALSMELIRQLLLYALRAYTYEEERRKQEGKRKEKGGGGD